MANTLLLSIVKVIFSNVMVHGIKQYQSATINTIDFKSHQKVAEVPLFETYEETLPKKELQYRDRV